MTFEEAWARGRQLNSIAFLKKQEKRLRLMKLEERELGRKYQAFLPEEFMEEFEVKFLRKRELRTQKQRDRYPRAHNLWRAVQKLVIHIKLEPTEWFCNTEVIYDYFYEKKLSISYMNKILGVLNLWGFFLSKKIDQPFLPVRRPRGYERQRLIDNYYEHIRTKRRESKPLSSKILGEAHGKMKESQFNWLFISLWLGLRPQEIDNLKMAGFWKKEQLPTGTTVLWIYQTKLVQLPFSDRWKAIPLIHQDQMQAMNIIQSKEFERPLVKTIRKYCGEGFSLYAGRKGFVDLMLENGHSLAAISQWMGHATISRTWRTYKNRLGFSFSLPTKAA